MRRGGGEKAAAKCWPRSKETGVVSRGARCSMAASRETLIRRGAAPFHRSGRRRGEALRGGAKTFWGRDAMTAKRGRAAKKTDPREARGEGRRTDRWAEERGATESHL